ncbi:MAG: EAL domain-containing protein [Desulfuromonadales bacterium]|nr:EAL domain-containing protein [Desulfuromonadales bacterium]
MEPEFSLIDLLNSLEQPVIILTGDGERVEAVTSAARDLLAPIDPTPWTVPPAWVQELLPPLLTGAVDERRLYRTIGTGGERRHLQVVLKRLASDAILIFFQEAAGPGLGQENIRQLIQGVSTATGATFFRSLVRHLVYALNADHALIGEFVDADRQTIRTVALCIDGEIADNFQFPLAGSPCARVVKEGLQCFPDKVPEQFPEELRAAQLGVVAYYGIPLQDAEGRVIGLMAVMGRRPLLDTQIIVSILQVFAARAASELEHQIAAEARQEQLHFLQSLLDAIPNPIFFKDLEGRYLGCNASLTRTLGVEKAALVGRQVFDVAPAGRAWLCYREDQAVFASGEVRAYETSLTYADGRQRVVVFNKAPFYHRNGEMAGLVGVIHDLTDRKEVEERYRILFDQSPDAILILDPQTSAPIQFNAQMPGLLGYTAEEFATVRLNDPQVNADPTVCREKTAGILANNGQEEFECQLLAKNGEPVAVLIRARAIEIAGQRALHMILRDITQSKLAERQIYQLAYFDSLTGLPNRTLLRDRIHQEIAQAKRSGKKFAIFFLDLDRFKRINDSLGHSIGDQMLKQVSQRLISTVRRSDTIARLGGDEFIILLPQLRHQLDAARVAEKILASLHKPFVMGETEMFSSASIGIALYPDDGQDKEDLLKNADLAMYQAKERGRNTYQFFAREMNQQAIDRMAVESHLRRALERREFILYYQPQIEVQTGRITGLEALIRWQQPELGLVPPAQFIPLAEETGLIIPIGEWVLEEACSQNRRWQEAGLPSVTVAVNISGRQFKEGTLVQSVRQVLKKTGLAPNWLELEMTETILMENADNARETLEQLKAMGVKLTIDDFGTGYSSLNYLKHFPLDRLKIDQSFVRDLIEDPHDARIVEAVIALAHSLQLTVVAEGVETVEQLEFLQQRRCLEMQGYLFSRPKPATDIPPLFLSSVRPGA